MRFTVEKSDLLKELQLVQGVVEKKTTVPVLANLLLRAGREGVEIVATDMEIGIQSACEAKVEEPGEILIHARKLHDIVKALPDGEVKFGLQKANRVQIRCGTTDFKISGQGVEEFPSLREYDFKGAITVPFELLRSMIERVKFAITVDDPRYAIYGALFIAKKSQIEMVATDGHRLAYVKRQADIAPKEEIREIIPSKALAEIEKLEPGPEGEVRIGVKDKHIFVRTGLRTIQSSLFEGTFPNYEKVIPVGNDRTVRCGAEALLSALRRVSLLCVERTKAVKVAVQDDTMTVSSSNPEFGEAEETLNIEGFKGGRLEIGFNAKFLMDFLQILGNSEVVLELKDENTQGLLMPADGEGLSYRYVVMPMRI